MGGRVGRVNEEVIHVNDEPSFCDHIVKGVIHEALESGRRIGKTKEHHSGFEESLMGDEGGFPLMPVFDSDIIVSPLDIELGKDFHPLEFIDKVRNEGKRVCFLMKKKGNTCGELEGQILLVFRFLSRMSSVAFRSSGEREYTLPILGLKDLSRLIS